MSNKQKKPEQPLFEPTPEKKKQYDKEELIKRGELPRHKYEKVERDLVSDERMLETAEKMFQILEQRKENELFCDMVDYFFEALGVDKDKPATTELDLYDEIEYSIVEV